MSLKQVSMVSLRAATTRHHHTDRVGGDTYQPTYSPLPAKGRKVREQKRQATINGTRRQTAHSYSWQAKHKSPAKPV